MEKIAKKIRPWVKTIIATMVSLFAIISAIVFAYFSVTTLLKGYSLEAEDKYLFFKDILLINLTIIGVIFAAIVFWIHVFITERIKNNVTKSLVERDVSITDYVQGLALLNDGFTCWMTYKTFGKGIFLDLAINLTKKAKAYVWNLTDENPRNLEIKCQTMNNLGYYLAERANKKDKEFAIWCANYINDRIVDYPEYQAHWTCTYDFITSRKWRTIVHLDPQAHKVPDQ